MGSKFGWILFVNLLFISWSTQIGPPVQSSTAAHTEEQYRLARAANEFGYKLMLKMMKQNENNNIVISPSGIAGLLAMTLLGTAGTTYDELAKVLGFSQDILINRGNHETFGKLLQELNDISPDENTIPTMDLANTTTDLSANFTANMDLANTTTDVSANFTANPNSSESVIEDILSSRTLYADAVVVDSKIQIRDVYRDYLERVYHGEAFNTQFDDAMKSQQLINDWVKNHTSSKIEEFLKDPLPTDTKVVLLSALYFSGQWAQPFVPEYTREMDFHSPNGDVIADLMFNAGKFNFTMELHNDKYMHMIAFPYNDSSTTMYVMKPFTSKNLPHHSLPELMESLDYATIEGLMDNMTQQECVVRFPKMDLKTKVNLKDALTELGIKSMFSKDANFALMVDNNPLLSRSGELVTRIYTGEEESTRLKDIVNSLPNPGMIVDTVLHDVKMTINEYGTVAVAATSGFLSRTARTFYADSPFYMFIRNEKTKLVTFSAVIFDPTNS